MWVCREMGKAERVIRRMHKQSGEGRKGFGKKKQRAGAFKGGKGKEHLYRAEREGGERQKNGGWSRGRKGGLKIRGGGHGYCETFPVIMGRKAIKKVANKRRNLEAQRGGAQSK